VPLESQVDNSHDKSFFATFAIVLGALFAFCFVIIFIAGEFGSDDTDTKAVAKLVDQNTAPVGTVVTDPSLLMKVSAKSEVHATLTGEQIVAQTCSACHGAGVLGAPKIGDKADWSKRRTEAGGVDGLVKFAISGKNQMPPRGGNADLTDAEIKSAVEAMLKQTGI
jgi:cytochrome c5